MLELKLNNIIVIIMNLRSKGFTLGGEGIFIVDPYQPHSISLIIFVGTANCYIIKSIAIKVMLSEAN